MTNLSEAVDLTEITAGLPRRIHQVADKYVVDFPDRVALIEDGASWTYRELDRSAVEVSALLSSFGVRPGDRIIIVSENCIALGRFAVGGEPDRCLGDRRQSPTVRARTGPDPRSQRRSPHVFHRRRFEGGRRSRIALWCAAPTLGSAESIGVGPLNENAIAEPVEADPAKQVAVLIYTSGTTGTPKGVMLTHENLLVSAKTTAHFRKMDADDKVYVVLPISHIVGISLLIMTLMVGGTARLVSKYDPGCAGEGDRGGSRSPSSTACRRPISACWNTRAVAGIKQLDRGSLRLIAVAGAPLDLDLKMRVEQEFESAAFERLWHHRMFARAYPECGSTTPRDDHAVGTLLPGIEARVRTVDGIPLANGEVGELHVRGRNVMRGYYRAPELTAKAIDSEGWFNTGDLARFDGECLYIVGRTKEMIIRPDSTFIRRRSRPSSNSHKAVVQSAVVGRSVEWKRGSRRICAADASGSPATSTN